MYKSLSKSIIRDVTLKESILHIKSNTAVDISLIEDAGKGIVFYNLIAHGVWGNTVNCICSALAETVAS